MVFFDDLGFRTDYEVESDIEYPGNGNWGMPILDVIHGPTLPSPAPIAIVRPQVGEPWVLAAGFAGLGEVFGTPNPRALCVVERYGRAVWIDTQSHEQVDHGILLPVHVAASVDHGLLLISEPNSITAIGAEGIRWVARGLVGDDLHITRSDGDRIYFRGQGFDFTSQLRGSLDARTGEVFEP